MQEDIDHIVLSPDSRQLADYEEYSRRELPRIFRATLEEIIQTQSQPIEESIRNQLTNIIQDCQDRVFAGYRSSAGRAAASPSRNSTSPHSSFVAPETSPDMFMVANVSSELSSGGIPPFFQTPPPQNHLQSRLEVSDLQTNAPKAPNSSDPSDSGYSSLESGVPPGNPSLTNNSSYSTSLPNSQANSQPQPTSGPSPAYAQGTWDMDNGLLDMSSGMADIDSHETGTWWENGAQLADGDTWNASLSNKGIEDPFAWDQEP